MLKIGNANSLWLICLVCVEWQLMILCGEISPARKLKIWLNYFLNIEVYVFGYVVFYGPD